MAPTSTIIAVGNARASFDGYQTLRTLTTPLKEKPHVNPGRRTTQ